MTENSHLHPSIIQSKIYTIRNQKVMLDFDLAKMYNVETRILNQAVKRNILRFPPDFMFQITDIEWDSMSSQFVMTSKSKRPKTALPLVFTEHGVTMLASILRSNTAIQISIQIVRAFVAVRNMLSITPADRVSELQSELQQLKAYIDEVFTDYNDINEDTRIQIELINESLAQLHNDNLQMDKPRRKIGYILD